MSTSRCSSKIFATDVHRHAVLMPGEMARVDQQAIAHEISGFQLMDAAGKAVVAQICQRWTVRKVSVLCGPGNNGGDGFVIARLLHQRGWPVRVGLLGQVSALKAEAREHAELWSGPVEPLSPDFVKDAGLVVDALFGTGLSRPLDDLVQGLVIALNETAVPVCAVDIPTGIDGGTGQVLGAAVHADMTVSFHLKKPGLLLMPGRVHCGELHVVDIGIPDQIVAAMNIQTVENHPDIWLADFPWPRHDHHKYMRGHVLIRGGDVMTGAARLSAMAAARAGAGLVTVAVSPASWPVYAAALTSAIVLPCDSSEAWQMLLDDRRRNVAVMGPGAGVTDLLRHDILLSLQDGVRTVVLDADALTVFSGQGDALFQAICGPCVLTPHHGEFERLFDGVPGVGGSKLERARAAARLSGAVVVLKGADTVVAAPDGRAVINSNAPPELATGGTGDVLTGIIAGLAAQGMDTFLATAAAVWMHGRAATLSGPGLIAEDLPAILIQVLRELRDSTDNG